MLLARAWVCWLGASLALCACASAPTTRAATKSAAAAPQEKTPEIPLDAAIGSGDPVKDLAEAQALEQEQLGIAARDARFATDRQIATLKRAKQLYGAVIEHAKGRPGTSEASARCRERIEDIDRTIDSLEQGADPVDSP